MKGAGINDMRRMGLFMTKYLETDIDVITGLKFLVFNPLSGPIAAMLFFLLQKIIYFLLKPKRW